MLANACSAGSSAPPPASGPTEVDPLTEIIEIPPGQCEPIGGWYAFSPRALKAVLDKQTEDARECAAQVERAMTAERLAQEQRRAAMEALEHAQFWQRWGPIIVLTVGGVAAAVGAAGGALLERALRP